MMNKRNLAGNGLRRGFTLIEVTIMIVIVSMVGAVIYKIFSGTWSSFFKSQTKMTNLRSANLILEQLKRDLRMAVPGTDSLISMPQGGGTAHASSSLIFKAFDRSGQPRQVTYAVKDRVLSREVEGETSRKISRAPVLSFEVGLEPAGPNGGALPAGTKQGMRVRIQVDETPEGLKTKEVNRTNAVELATLMYPPFFDSSVSYEEKCWYAASQWRR